MLLGQDSQFETDRVKDQCQALKDMAGVFFGTSSWKYEGWRGLVYKGYYRNKSEFNSRCLSEYAQVFPCVGGDFAFYALPSESVYSQLRARTPTEFKFVLKATGTFTAKHNVRSKNPYDTNFLDPNAFADLFLHPAKQFLEGRLAAVVMEFGKFHTRDFERGRDFVAALDKFFLRLGKETLSTFPISVEMRNQSWFVKPFLEMLKSHGISLTANSWTAMPPLDEQLALAKEVGVHVGVIRALLNVGQGYDDMTELYEPYTRIHTPLPKVRQAIAEFVGERLNTQDNSLLPSYILINNQLEGSAPLTVQSITKILEERSSKPLSSGLHTLESTSVLQSP